MNIKLIVLLSFIFVSVSFASNTLSKDFFGFYSNEKGSPIFDLIDAAKESIDIEIYQMSDPDVLNGLRDALKRGVKIRVVKDPTPVGDKCLVFTPTTDKDDQSCKDQKKLVGEVNSNGGNYVPFVKEKLCGQYPVSNMQQGQSCFEHGKMMIVDNEVVMLSTGNYNSTNLCNKKYNPERCNRDYSYIINEPDLVKTFLDIFNNDSLGEQYDLLNLIPDALKTEITVSPYSLEPIVDFIKSAKVSIYVQNQYLKNNTWNAALLEKAKVGVKVYVDVASFCSFGTPSASDVKKATEIYTAFDNAGIKTSTFTSMMKVGGVPGYNHAKAIVVDEKEAWVGSVNGSVTATDYNREFGVFFSNKDDVKEMLGIIKGDINNKYAETWRESLACKNDNVQINEDQDWFLIKWIKKIIEWLFPGEGK